MRGCLSHNVRKLLVCTCRTRHERGGDGYVCDCWHECQGSTCPHRLCVAPTWFLRGLLGKGLVRTTHIPRMDQVLRHMARILAVGVSRAVWIEHALSIRRPLRTVGLCGSPGRTRHVRPRICPAPRACYVLLTRSMAYGPKSTYRSIRGLDT